MTFWEDAGPVILPVAVAVFVPRLPTFGLVCAMAAAGAGFVLSLLSTTTAVAVMGAGANTVLFLFCILELVQRFSGQSNKRRRFFE